MIAIYKLIDPRTSATRYVGRTKNPKARLIGHMNGHLPWVHDLKAAGIAPVMECIEWVSDKDAPKKERFWIKRLKSDGCDLVNKNTFEEIPMLTLKVDTDLHRRLKIHACQNGYKLQDFVERVLEKSLNRKRP